MGFLYGRLKLASGVSLPYKKLIVFNRLFYSYSWLSGLFCYSSDNNLSINFIKSFTIVYLYAILYLSIE